jgi:mRNA interferase MazF
MATEPLRLEPLVGGQIVWMDFDPVRGTEQAGSRPALVISEAPFHAATRRAVVCPITTRRRDWPFETPLPDGLPVKGVVLIDQVRTVDRTTRGFRPICVAPDWFLAQVRTLVGRLIGFED